MDSSKRIGIGRTAEVFADGTDRVLKLFYPHVPEQMAESEFMISSAVYQLGLPTPEAKERVTKDGRQGIIYERISGMTMLTLIGKRPWLYAREARRLAALHHDIHQRTVTGFPSVASVWEQRIRYTPLLNDMEKQLIIRRLHRLGGGDTLCHGDLHPDNIIIGRQVWVMDWMTGMCGSPAADAARTALILSTASVPPEAPKLLAAIIRTIQKRIYQTYLNEYLKLSKRNRDELEAWILPAAAARLVESLPDAEKEGLLQLIRSRLREDAGPAVKADRESAPRI